MKFVRPIRYSTTLMTWQKHRAPFVENFLIYLGRCLEKSWGSNFTTQILVVRDVGRPPPVHRDTAKMDKNWPRKRWPPFEVLGGPAIVRHIRRSKREKGAYGGCGEAGRGGAGRGQSAQPELSVVVRQSDPWGPHMCTHGPQCTQGALGTTLVYTLASGDRTCIYAPASVYTSLDHCCLLKFYSKPIDIVFYGFSYGCVLLEWTRIIREWW